MIEKATLQGANRNGCGSCEHYDALHSVKPIKTVTLGSRNLFSVGNEAECTLLDPAKLETCVEGEVIPGVPEELPELVQVHSLGRAVVPKLIGFGGGVCIRNYKAFR